MFQLHRKPHRKAQQSKSCVSSYEHAQIWSKSKVKGQRSASGAVLQALSPFSLEVRSLPWPRSHHVDFAGRSASLGDNPFISNPPPPPGGITQHITGPAFIVHAWAWAQLFLLARQAYYWLVLNSSIQMLKTCFSVYKGSHHRVGNDFVVSHGFLNLL